MTESSECRACGGTGVSGPNGQTCSRCGMSLGPDGLKVEGNHFMQVFAVAAGLIILLFLLYLASQYLSSG